MCLTKWLHECGRSESWSHHNGTWMSCCVQNSPWEYSIHTILCRGPLASMWATIVMLHACVRTAMHAQHYIPFNLFAYRIVRDFNPFFFASFGFLILLFIHCGVIIIAQRAAQRERGKWHTHTHARARAHVADPEGGGERMQWKRWNGNWSRGAIAICCR